MFKFILLYIYIYIKSIYNYSSFILQANISHFSCVNCPEPIRFAYTNSEKLLTFHNNKTKQNKTFQTTKQK